MGEAVAGTVGERFRELYGAEPEGCGRRRAG